MSNPVDSRGIPPGAIKDRQISGQAKINPGKLAQVDAGQVLVGQDSRKLAAKTVSGDATLAADGTLTLNQVSVEGQVKKVLQELNIESGAQANVPPTAIKKLYEELPQVRAFTPQYSQMMRNANSENTADALIKRDSDGNFTAGTMTGTSTNSTKLNNQTATYYTNVDNHVNGDTTTLGVVGTGLAGSTNKKNVKKIVYEAIAGGGSHYYYTIPHNFGYYPHVTVMHGTPVDPNANPIVYNYEEIDAEVENGTTSTTVRTSEQGLVLKMILS